MTQFASVALPPPTWRLRISSVGNSGGRCQVVGKLRPAPPTFLGRRYLNRVTVLHQPTTTTGAMTKKSTSKKTTSTSGWNYAWEGRSFVWAADASTISFYRHRAIVVSHLSSSGLRCVVLYQSCTSKWESLLSSLCAKDASETGKPVLVVVAVVASFRQIAQAILGCREIILCRTCKRAQINDVTDL